ncbi:uncharacterized protein [Typha latifolia]|uniref:uncharacterized protein n=1 Tax=Typha latifolia TaxID=4733 RepID=UPI003C2ADC29
MATPKLEKKKKKDEYSSFDIINPSSYAHSPAHYAVVLRDHGRLSRLVSSLPLLSHPSQILSLSDSLHESRLADLVSAVLDRRDVPGGDSPLHLAVRLDLPSSFLSLLLSSGADPSLQNSSGWTPLQEALSLRRRRLAALLLRRHRLSAVAKLRRRLPSLLSALARLQDFYLELAFHFESPLLPFLSRAAPSDTYRIWKRGVDLRADTSLAGFDGLRVRRADQSFLFLGEGSPPGSLLVLHRGRREVRDAFEDILSNEDDNDDDDVIADASAYRPGLDITAAELVPRTNWRRREKTEMVGEWKCRVYDVHNVVFTFKTLRAADDEDDGDGEIVPLDIREDDEDGFLVAEIPPTLQPPRHSCYEPRRRSSGAGEVEMGRRRSVDLPRMAMAEERIGGGKRKEKEMVKNLRPSVWLTEDFPLKVEEIMPLLDILSSKVKAVRRLRELLTTKFPPGTFPVKVAIPVVPTVRVVVTFNKFAPLQQPEQFFTPLSSPSLFPVPEGKEHQLMPDNEEEHPKTETHKSSWLKWNSYAVKSSLTRSKSVSPSQVTDSVDPFSIPSDYTWVRSSKKQEMKRSKSRKGKQRDRVSDILG